MKMLTLNKRSWLWKLANYGGYYGRVSESTRWDDEQQRFVGGAQTDLCSLFWHVLWGAIRAPFWTALLGGVGAAAVWLLVLGPVIQIIVWRNNPAFEFSEWVVGVGLIWLGALGLASIAMLGVIGFWDKVQDKIRESSPVEWSRAAYRGWKDKTCVLVEVKE